MTLPAEHQSSAARRCGLDCPDATFLGRSLCRRVSIADQNAASGIAIAGHFDKNDGQLIRSDAEFLLQDLSDALGRPAFLLGATALQHGDLNVWHRALPMSCGYARQR